MFKNQMKTKRRKTGDGGAKKNEKGNILERQELVVQRLSSEVSSKASSRTRDSRPIANDYESSSSRQQFFSEPVKPPRRNRQDPNKAQSTGSPNAKHLIPKSLSILHMMKLGKLAKPNESVSVLDIYSFDLENIVWSLLPQKVEFVIEEDVLVYLMT